MRRWFAAIVLLSAAGLWGWRLLPDAAPTEEALRRTDGIGAEIVAAQPTERGVLVTCRVSNYTARIAEQIVLTVALTNDMDEVVAANPLANLSDLGPGESGEGQFLVPTSGPHPDAQPRVEVSLVRW